MDNNHQGQNAGASDQGSSSGMHGGMTDNPSSTIDGGQSKGDDQSYLSKGIEAVQQSVFGKGNVEKQSSVMDQETRDIHAAVDQAHPEKIAEFMRDKYMTRTAEQQREEGRK